MRLGEGQGAGMYSFYLGAHGRYSAQCVTTDTKKKEGGGEGVGEFGKLRPFHDRECMISN
jgi:hypothetical protein